MECKAQVYFADIDESFAMIIEPLKSVSIQPSTSPVKFARPLSAYGSPRLGFPNKITFRKKTAFASALLTAPSESCGQASLAMTHANLVYEVVGAVMLVVGVVTRLEDEHSFC